MTGGDERRGGGWRGRERVPSALISRRKSWVGPRVFPRQLRLVGELSRGLTNPRVGQNVREVIELLTA